VARTYHRVYTSACWRHMPARLQTLLKAPVLIPARHFIAIDALHI
jgi:hypothetical protein